jgi:hypothetical protein
MYLEERRDFKSSDPARSSKPLAADLATPSSKSLFWFFSIYRRRSAMKEMQESEEPLFLRIVSDIMDWLRENQAITVKDLKVFPITAMSYQALFDSLITLADPDDISSPSIISEESEDEMEDITFELRFHIALHTLDYPSAGTVLDDFRRLSHPKKDCLSMLWLLNVLEWLMERGKVRLNL